MTAEASPPTNDTNQTDHDWSGDLVLRALQDLEEPVGSLVRAFPGRGGLSDQPEWLEDWFVSLATRFRDGEGPDLKEIVASATEEGHLSLLAKEPVESAIRLVAIRPYWFRGFRVLEQPIRFESDLVVIEGRNSSGKTSISEAIEWVLTGQLSRRTSGEQGHPTELADCIANEFRPDTEPTSVDLTVSVDGNLLRLKRVLTKDYSTVASDRPESDLMIDGELASGEDERQLFGKLLAGVHPILMQHNLRRFVHDDPRSRRQYFERLLQIDELTALVEKAVIGKKRSREIANPAGGAGLAALRDLAKELGKDRGDDGSNAAKELRKLERSDPGEIPTLLDQVLTELADGFLRDEVNGLSGILAYRERIEEAQKRQRESRLPLLATLEASRTTPQPTMTALRAASKDLREAIEALTTADQAAADIADAEQKIAQATNQLIDANLLDPEAEDDQDCPVCEDGVLTPARLRKIVSWGPLSRAVEVAKTGKGNAVVKVSQEIDRLEQAVLDTGPDPVAEKEVRAQVESLPNRARGLAKSTLKSANRVRDTIGEIAQTVDQAKKRLESNDLTAADVDEVLSEIEAALGAYETPVAEHRQDVDSLQEAIGAASRDDADYRLREKWLNVAGLTAAIAEDIGWEAAKAKAGDALNGLREGLIDLRTEIVEDARRSFSEEMTEIWGLLREDSGAAFSELHVPPARGKGFKLEFELKAVISDGDVESEVDALRVFSESQVNVVGIAAYVTRAKRMGHRMLIFDDPVQSMDEEHFRSFAVNLIPTLIDDGYQVVILTHNHAFAACVHEHNFERESYATLTTRASKRQGCCVDEGSRRVSERLKVADKAAEDGDLERAWRFVRLAIERMYLLVKLKSEDKFDPTSWRDHAAEAMWNEGVGEVVEEAAPGSAKRLKEILDSTAAGTHDKPATSETALKAAVRDLRALLDPLRLGAG